MPTKGEGAIGALDYTTEERQQLAKKSQSWKCPKCGSDNATALPEEPESPAPTTPPTPPSPQPERTTTPAPSTTNTNITNNVKPAVSTPPPTSNNNNTATVHNNNNNTPIQAQQPLNANRYQYPPNQFQQNQFQANIYQQPPQYQVNQFNQYQQPNQMYQQQVNYGNAAQHAPVPDIVRRQQAFLDLVILSLFLVIVALILNKLTKDYDM